MIIYTLFILFLISLNFDKIILFNGTDLTGWKIYGTEKWYVKDNLLLKEAVSILKGIDALNDPKGIYIICDDC